MVGVQRIVASMLLCLFGWLSMEDARGEEILVGELATVIYPQGSRPKARETLAATEAALGELLRTLDLRLPHVEIHLVHGATALNQATAGRTPHWALAVALPAQRRIIVRADLIGPADSRLAAVVAHELTHLALGSLALPIWFEEGLCDWVGGTSQLENALRDPARLRFDAIWGTLPQWREMDSAYPRSAISAAQWYAAGYSAVAFIERRHPGALNRTLTRVQAGEPFSTALTAATGEELPSLEMAWRQSLTPRWPLLFLIGSSIDITTALAIAVVFGALIVRQRSRRQLAALEAAMDPDHDTAHDR